MGAVQSAREKQKVFSVGSENLAIVLSAIVIFRRLRRDRTEQGYLVHVYRFL